MCGIVGILGQQDVSDQLVATLRRLEYRGYDSAGIATVRNGALDRRRAQGKLTNLEALLSTSPLEGRAGIGHTRWATHGAPSERNAHPHMTERVSVVHNGIIENYRELRAEFSALGYVFTSDTDTEAIVHLVTYHLDQGLAPVEAVGHSLKRLRGAFALGLIFKGEDNLMIAARRGSPLAIGHNAGEMYFGSDAIALAPYTDTITYLEDGDWAVLTRASVEIFDENGVKVERKSQKSTISAQHIEKGNHRHYMSKEIAEQPEVISRTLANYIDMNAGRVRLERLPANLDKISRITISACGTAHYAGQVAKYWFEQYARLPVEIDVASEFRYREVPLEKNGLALFISQSGETADTLACLRYCKQQGQRIAAVVNVPTSTIARESDDILPTYAGPEIGVASTKAFTCQLAVLAALAIGAGRARGVINAERERELIAALAELPRHISSHIHQSAGVYEKIGTNLSSARDVLYLGRGMTYPIAMEGALKLKEISYIHAEGYAAGELKHGPIALIDKNVPVIILAPDDNLFDKTVSNLQEVAARGGRIILISDAEAERVGCEPEAVIALPKVHPFTSPVMYALPMQLIAYHTAVAIGTDVDQPRNLAKSVTVE
jgi:glucosamine--fructose-6-phosphate aminotransferase (isomerizing)